MTIPKRAVPPRLFHLVTADPAPDADLLSRFIKSQDEAAFAALIERHGPMVLRVCRRALWDAHAAEDAFQATFLALIRGARRVRKTASVASWLYGAAVRISLKARGAAARAQRTPNPSPTRYTPDPLAEMTGRELVSAIDEELARLPDQFRAAITLCCLEGLSQEEAARRLGWSASSVKGRLERGRERLRVRLAQRGLALSAGLGSLLLGEVHAVVPPRLFAQTVELAKRKIVSPSVAELAAGMAPTNATWKTVAVALVVLAVGGMAALGHGNQPPRTSPPHPPEAATVPTRPIDQLSDSLPEENIRRLAEDPPAKTDRYGDPLPPGALLRLGTLRNRAPITGFGIQKDGIVVTVGPGADVRRWNRVDDKSEEPIALPLERAKTFNNDPQVSPDGKLVAASTNEKVFVWETPTAAKVKPKEVAAFEIARAGLFRFAPDGTKLIATAHNGETSAVYVCDIKTGKATSLNANPRYIEGVSFSGDGKRVGVVADNDFYFLDAVTGEQLAKYRTDGRMSSAFALNHTGDVLAARMDYSGPKYEFRFTDPLTGKKLDGLTGPEGWVRWISFTADGKALLIGDRSGIRWWDPTAAKQIRTFEGIAFDAFNHQHPPARVSPDGKTLVAHNGYVLLRWEVPSAKPEGFANTGKPLFPEQNLGHGAYIYGVGVSADGKRIATGGMDSRVCVWDAVTGKELSHAPADWTNRVGIDFSPDGKFLFVSPEWGEVAKLDAATGKTVTKFVTDPKKPQQASVYTVRLSKDGKTVFALSGPYTANDPGFVTEWDADTGERKKVTQLPFAAVHGSELSPGAMFVARGHFGQGGVVAVGAPEKNLLENSKIPGFSFQPGHFSDDGQWLTQINTEKSGDGWVHSAVVISATNWGVACTIPLTEDGLAALSPEGKTLAVAHGGKIEFYDTATTRSLGNIRVPAGEWEHAPFGYTHALRFTPDGTKLITGHADTTALVWPVPPRPAK